MQEVTRDHGLRRISRLAFRGLIAAFMTVVVAGALYWVWTTVEDRRLERIVSQTKEWESQKTLHSPLIATLKTRCSNSMLYYKLVINANTLYQVADQALAEARGEKVKQTNFSNAFRQLKKGELNLEFYDPDGFKVVKVIVKSNELTQVVKDNEIIRLEASASTLCNRRAYAQAATWVLSQTTYK